ncbi:MAG: Glycosyl transferase [uncultured Campylobacterales bacterium]|uniref:Glycosyl transferase n=1 Tax=uncultured Campylobacterales bacterium TaxID=352960 RepID=A0A6S6SF34_9BACT|nr:MAG: Glycosyl transferase [uncultured Campylobacterales bacterium]
MIDFKTVIKAVGTGPKGNRNLSKDEVEFAMKSIMNRELSDAQIGAFLQGWRLSGESHEELKYAYEYVISRIKYSDINENSIFCGYAYDGKIRNPYLLVLASKYLKDIKISLSIDDLVPAKNGVTTKMIPKEALTNTILNDRSDFLNKVSTLAPIRRELIVRTAFNTIEKLFNPSKSKYGVVGFTHGAYKEFYTSLRVSAGFDRLVVVKGGDEGSPDISKSCKLFILDEEKDFDIVLDIKDFGIESISTRESKTKEEIISLMTNNNIDEKLIKLNASLLLIASKKYDDIKEAYNSL